MTAVFRACGKTPERRDMLTTCKRSEAMQLDTLLKKHAERLSRQQEGI